MKEHKLPEGLTLPESKADMHEHKFPHDYAVQELVDKYRDAPYFDENEEKRLIEDHRTRTRGVAGVLADAAERLRSTIPAEHHVDINAAFGSVASALDGTMPNTRWVIMDYQVGTVIRAGNKVELEEHTRPHGDICHRYWAEVNS